MWEIIDHRSAKKYRRERAQKNQSPYKEEKIYILKNEELRIGITWLHYDALVVEHKKRWKTTELVAESNERIEGYNLYQRMNNRTETVLEKPWTHLTVKFITKLLSVAGKDAILVVYNRLSKIVHFVARIEETLVEELVWLFRDNMQK